MILATLALLQTVEEDDDFDLDISSGQVITILLIVLLVAAIVYVWQRINRP
jgi:hypothetical protein